MRKLRQGMKRKVMLSAVLAGMLLAGLPAHADSEIRVIIEGEEVEFGKSPVIVDGVTLVPFRVLFEKLGLSVHWSQATKAIDGEGKGVAIGLQIGRKTAVVNGREVELPAAPRIVDGSAYVPLRLVGEATGRQVNWDGATRTITIGAVPSVQGKDADPVAFYRSYLAAYNAEDLEAILSALHPDSPLHGAQWSWEQEDFRIYDVVTELVKSEVLQTDGSSALLRTVERRTNTNGLFYPDNEMTLLVHVLRDDNGEWKFYDSELLEAKILVTEEALKADADIDGALEKALLDVVARHIEATDAEDRDAVIGTYDPGAPELSLIKLGLNATFYYLDLDYKLEYGNVIQVAGNEAYVYAVYTAELIDGFEYEGITDVRSKQVFHLRQQPDGSWKIYRTFTLWTEPLD